MYQFVFKKAFTLVELIVVITILSILGTISFLSFSGYSKTARDSKRVSNVDMITKGIGVTLAKDGLVNVSETANGIQNIALS